MRGSGEPANEADAMRTKVTTADLMSLDLAAHTAPGKDEPMVLGNTTHFTGPDLPLATAEQAVVRYPAFRFEWDNKGRNANFFPFEWAA